MKKLKNTINGVSKMKITDKINSFWLIMILVGSIAVVSVACGPKAGGKGITTAGGGVGAGGGGGGGGGVVAEISPTAKDIFTKAVEEFKMHSQAKDWNDSVCKDVAEKFEDASKEQKGGLPIAIYNAGLVYHECGKFDEARAYFKQALQMDPNYASPRTMLANYVYQSGDVSKAETMYQDVIKGAPLALESVEAYVNLAMIQRTKATGDRAKNQEEAMKNLRRALAIDAQSMAAFTEMAYLYLDLAEKDKNKLTLAEVVCVQATKIDPNYAPIYNVWGLLKMRQGEIIDALKYFEKAFTLDPKMFEAYMNFGSIAISFRGYEDAKTVFSKAVELKPDSYDARINLGVAKRGLEDYDGAEAEYLKAIEIDKTRPEAYYNLGVLYQDYRLDKAGTSGYENFVSAIDWYKKFLGRASGNKAMENFVAEAQKRINDSQKAIDLIKEAATLMKEAGSTPPPEGAGAQKEGAKQESQSAQENKSPQAEEQNVNPEKKETAEEGKGEKEGSEKGKKKKKGK